MGTRMDEESPPPAVGTVTEDGARVEREASARRRGAAVLGGFAAFLVTLALPLPLPPEARRTAAVAALMAVWWITEAIPLAATALVPLVLFPVLGILTPNEAAAPYANPVIFLFMGGFVLAFAMQRWELHRRIALSVVVVAGVGPRRLVLGFMVATATISMWVSNTATAAMMLPIAVALVEVLRPAEGARFPFGTALMLGIAYGATIGGLGTLIGSPPNLIFAGAVRELLGREVGFVYWMMIGVPLVIVFLPVAWALLVYVLFPPGELPPGARELLERERRGLGRVTSAELRVMGVFAFTVVAWLFREPKVIGGLRIPGITDVLAGVDDATIAMLAALLLFLLPAGRAGAPRIMDWDTAKRLPWGVLILFGGGLSLSRAFEVSGLARAIGDAVTGLAGLPEWLVLGAVCAIFVWLTEISSNTAISAMAMPILAAAAPGMDMDPVPLMAVAALGASGAFMMPVATPPNAIVFGSGYIRMGEMIRGGVWLNFVSIVLMTLATLLIVRVALS